LDVPHNEFVSLIIRSERLREKEVVGERINRDCCRRLETKQSRSEDTSSHHFCLIFGIYF